MKQEKAFGVRSYVSVLAVAFALVAGGALADITDVRTWTDASGDHRWNNAKNWDPQKVANTRNVFPAGRDWEVIIEGTDKYYFSFELSEGSGTVTLKGEASACLLPGTGAFIQIPAGRELNVDGPELRTSIADVNTTGFINGTLRVTSGYLNTGGNSAKTFGGNANVVVDGGFFGHETRSGTLTFTNNATLTVNGGFVKIYRGIFHSPDPPRASIVRVLMTGGTYWNSEDEYAYITSFGSGAHFVNNGGTVIWSQAVNKTRTYLSSEPNNLDNKLFGEGEAFAELLPAFGSSLILLTASTSSYGALYFAVDGDYDVGGTIYATNNTAAAAGNVYFGSKNVALRGGATIYANAYKVNSYSVSNNDLDIARLNLGTGGFRREGSDGNWQTVNFLDGIEFGAWGGDVPRAEVSAYTSRLKLYLNGPVVYDTQDCFEPATTRTINMDRLYLDGVTELKATGGGTAALYPAEKWAEEFRTLEVADNTTLAFSTNTLAGLKAMNLKLGANATLKINMKNGDYVDASATAEFGEGAKIVVTDVPASLAEGKLYPVYFAPAGSVPDLSKIEYAGGDWPTGWGLAKTGNAVYLTDGKVKAYEESRVMNSTKMWSGAGADNIFTTPENWVSNDVAGTSYGANLAEFKGCFNTDISIAEALTIRYFHFYPSSGPFMFSGSGITLRYPEDKTSLDGSVGSQSVLNQGQFPVVIANAIQHRTSAQYPLQWFVFKAYGEGSISLTGGSSQSHPICFGGDIRFGGAWNADCLRSLPRYMSGAALKTAVRRSRLTVMPGATLTVTGQYGDFNEYGEGALAVARNATATIGGTQLLLASNNTHYVDGALTVTCPLVPQGRQTFRGDGTLTLAGGVAGAPGGVRVEGNMTLVPSNWVNGVELSVKGDVTIAPTGDWTLGGDATLDLAHHSKLTLATGGHKVTLAKPIASESGTLAVTGGGTLALTAGTELCKVTCAGGATLAIAANSEVVGQFVDVLVVREDDDSIAFDAGYKVEKRIDAETRYTVYSVRRKLGAMFILR